MSNKLMYELCEHLVTRLKLELDAVDHHESQFLETHSAWVILAGEHAYKFKKPVNFGFLDFSLLDKRKYFCLQELELNRRFAADIYLNLISVTGSGDEPQIQDGDHPQAIEYGIKMRRFRQRDVLSERADNGQLTFADAEAIASELAAFHLSAALVDETEFYGGFSCTRAWVRDNFTAMYPLLTGEKNRKEKRGLENLENWLSATEKNLGKVIDGRRQQGFVRDCHGDLHLNNMVFINDTVTFFDCIEFNPELRWIDTMNELAFVLMDLVARNCPQHANVLLNRYLEDTGDYNGLEVLNFYFVYRALVRAKVALLRRQQCDSEAADYAALSKEFSRYVALAKSRIEQGNAFIFITCGVSGSGKTTVARTLAREFNLIHIRSDIERKRLFGLQALDRSDSGLNENLYSADASEQTYEHLRRLACRAIEGGFSVLLDASFLSDSERDKTAALAHSMSVGYAIIYCRASSEVLHARVCERELKNNDASEANAQVLQAQLNKNPGLRESEKSLALTFCSDEPMALEKITQQAAALIGQ